MINNAVRSRRGAGTAFAVVLLAYATGATAQPPLEALPAILQLQLDQHPAWRAYKDAAAERRADAVQSASQAAQLNAMSTPQRLDALRTQMRAQQQSFEREAAATQDFYAALSPDQRRIFDEVTRLPVPPSPMRTNPGLAIKGPQVLRLPPPDSRLPPPAL